MAKKLDLQKVSNGLTGDQNYSDQPIVAQCFHNQAHFCPITEHRLAVSSGASGQHGGRTTIPIVGDKTW